MVQMIDEGQHLVLRRRCVRPSIDITVLGSGSLVLSCMTVQVATLCYIISTSVMLVHEHNVIFAFTTITCELAACGVALPLPLLCDTATHGPHSHTR